MLPLPRVSGRPRSQRRHGRRPTPQHPLPNPRFQAQLPPKVKFYFSELILQSYSTYYSIYFPVSSRVRRKYDLKSFFQKIESRCKPSLTLLIRQST